MLSRVISPKLNMNPINPGEVNQASNQPLMYNNIFYCSSLGNTKEWQI